MIATKLRYIAHITVEGPVTSRPEDAGRQTGQIHCQRVPISVLVAGDAHGRCRDARTGFVQGGIECEALVLNRNRLVEELLAPPRSRDSLDLTVIENGYASQRPREFQSPKTV